MNAIMADKGRGNSKTLNHGAITDGDIAFQS